MKQNSIDIYRRRIAIAALHRIKRKTGGYCLVINLPNKEIQTIELNEEAFQKLLFKQSQYKWSHRVPDRDGENDYRRTAFRIRSVCKETI